MNNSSPYELKIKVSGDLNHSQAQALVNRLSQMPTVIKVEFDIEKKTLDITSRTPLLDSDLDKVATSYGVDFTRTSNADVIIKSSRVENGGTVKVFIEGMHCRSCELTIERKFKNLPGITRVNANADKGVASVTFVGTSPSLQSLQQAVVDDGYSVKLANGKVNHTSFLAKERPSFVQLVILVLLIFLLGKLMSRFGLLSPNIGALNSSSFLAVFLLGLLAASSSCLAVSGGLLLSTVSKFNERYGSTTLSMRMRPVLLFVGGRLMAYGLLGGLIGLLGSALTPSPIVTGVITLLAAFYMLVMGLDMLRLAPHWLKRLVPRLPKVLSRKVVDSQDQTHVVVPFLLGAGTFFLPCGFTQALQLYALTTGSFWTSAWLLFGFALGTAPALLALGFASGSLKGTWGKYFFQFAGVLVIMLGLWNFQNGLSIMGYPLHWPRLWSQDFANSTSDNSSSVIFDGQEQIIKMKVKSYGYEPNQFTIRQGVPTKWEVDASEGGGCLSILQSPQLGVRKLLDRDNINEIEFTPSDVGNFTFSCSMGMYRGQINVVPNNQ